jgi:hypothetical protein
MPLILSCTEPSIANGGPFGHPSYSLQEFLGLPQTHYLDVHLTPPEVGGNYTGLIRPIPTTRDLIVVVGKDFFGKED